MRQPTLVMTSVFSFATSDPLADVRLLRGFSLNIRAIIRRRPVAVGARKAHCSVSGRRQPTITLNTFGACHTRTMEASYANSR